MTAVTLVVRNYDDAPCPLIGRIVSREDEDRVAVLWGDARFDPNGPATIEWMDELTPWRPR